MKMVKFFFAAIVVANFSNLSFGQTYNIPSSVGSPSSSYLGTVTGDLTLKSTASLANVILNSPTGNILLNSTTGTTTVPNIGINTDGNVGLGLLPPVNPTTGYHYYEPTLNVKGVDGNNAVPAWNPRSTFRVNTGTNTLDFGNYGNRAFLQANNSALALDLFAAEVKISQSSWGGGSLLIGNWGDAIKPEGGVSRLTGKLVIENYMENGNHTVNTPTGYGLYVQGGVLTEKVRCAVVNGTNWADYVFNKDYKLLSLGEVETYINKNKHLPDVPSAEEVVKDGIDMATMDAKLLQKIEELTLYMIEMKKENEKLKERVQVLETK
jgi:hypothetical protein